MMPYVMLKERDGWLYSEYWSDMSFTSFRFTAVELVLTLSQRACNKVLSSWARARHFTYMDVTFHVKIAFGFSCMVEISFAGYEYIAMSTWNCIRASHPSLSLCTHFSEEALISQQYIVPDIAKCNVMQHSLYYQSEQNSHASLACITFGTRSLQAFS